MSARTAERRTPRSAALRRLIAAGNLLAAAARGDTSATPELANAWDNSVEALRAELAEPRVIRATPDPRMRGMRCADVEHEHGVSNIPPRPLYCEAPLGAEADVQHLCAARADSDGAGYCNGCGTTIGEPHHPGCDRARRKGRAR